MTLPQSDGLDKTDIGTAINVIAIPTEKPMDYPFASKLEADDSSKTLAKGGVSWQVLDSEEAVRMEVSSVMESLITIGANRSAIPKHLYSLSLHPFTISVVLRWSSDLIERGINLASPSADQMGKTYRTLNQLTPTNCADVIKKANALANDDATKNDFENSLNNLANVIEYSSLARFRVDAWKEYFLNRLEKTGWNRQGSKNPKQEIKQDINRMLNSIRTEASLMPDEDLGQDLYSKSPFAISADNKALLAGNDVAKCLAAMGHGFIESYTEKASMTAVWTLTLPTTSDEELYAFRMAIQKYFFQPRRVSEVCEFFSSENIFDPSPQVKVSIFGYRNRSSHLPEDVLDELPLVANGYLKPDILARNTERQSIKMRAWKGLCIYDLLPPDSSSTKDMTVPELDEFFVLNVQKAERLLLLLILYSKDPEKHISKSKLENFGKQLDKVLAPKFLESNGTLSKDNRYLLDELVRDLEKALPDGDPEKDLK
ncbi:MAG: hypothetical protein Q9190_000759 [Brigantiaea leucoxantha]